MPRHAKISNTSLHLRALIPLGSMALFGLFLAPAGAQALASPSVPAAGNTAQARAALTLPSAIDLAMASNAELAAARRELEAAEGPVLQGRVRCQSLSTCGSQEKTEQGHRSERDQGTQVQ